ncbi:unnamed protein product, partial [Nesidiocoris tenuis]
MKMNNFCVAINFVHGVNQTTVRGFKRSFKDSIKCSRNQMATQDIKDCNDE